MSRITEATQQIVHTSSCLSINAQEEKSTPEITNDVEKTTVSEEQENYPTGVQFWLIILTLSSLLVLGGLDINIVATAVPRITDHFHTIADVGWYSSAFRLCSCAFQFVFGKLYKLFTEKHVMIFANVIFLVGSVLCAAATSSPMFIAGRAVSGAGFAGIISGFFIMLTHILPLRRRPFFCGVLGGIESIAIIAAPIVGGALTQSIGWRWCFWINLPITGTTLLMIFFFFPNPKESNSCLTPREKFIALDLPSNVVFIAGLTCLFLAFSWGGTKYDWKDGRVIGLFVVFSVLILLFMANQCRLGDAAALPPRLMKNRNVIAGAIFTMCVNSAINVIEYYLPTFYQVVHGFSPAHSGYMMVPIVVGSTIGMFVCGSGTTALGYYTPFMLLSSCLMPIFAGLISTFGLDTSLVKFILYSASFGFATGVAFNTPISAMQTVLATEDVSLGIAIILFAQHCGPAVFIAVAQTIFSNQVANNLISVIPNLRPGFIASTGITEIVKLIPPEQHKQALEQISKSLDQTWYLAVGLTCTTLVGSLLMEWRSVKKPQPGSITS